MNIFLNPIYKSYVRSAMLWKQNMVFERKWSTYFERSRKIYGKGDVQCKVGGQEEYKGADGHVGIEGSSRWTGKGEWYEVVWSCFKMTWGRCMVHEVNGKCKQDQPKMK